MKNELKELAVTLFEIDAVKFGSFKTKVGLQTPVYIDFRVLIAHRKILKQVSRALWKLSSDPNNVQQICGVPYAALSMADVIADDTDKPMIMRRKESKNYGTKKLLEGVYKAGDKCVIIEDVVTSGSSIIEVVGDLKNEGLEVVEALIIMDREQGGRDNLNKVGINIQSLFTLTEMMEYLLEAEKINKQTYDSVINYLKTNKASVKTIEKEKNLRLTTDFLSRSQLAKNLVGKKIYEIMATKETTLCLAADLTSADKIINLAEIAGPHIAVLKIHVNIIDDFSQDFIKQLKSLSIKYKFLIMEDSKFGDIGNTVSHQYSKGIYKIAEWADLITVHPIAGPGIIDGLVAGLNDISEERGIFLVTEMSSKGALTIGNYIEQSLSMGNNSKLVVGHVCQNNLFSNPGMIQLTPGVKLSKDSDDLGQQYNTPENVVNSGADLAVVGRGITKATDKLIKIIF